MQPERQLPAAAATMGVSPALLAVVSVAAVLCFSAAAGAGDGGGKGKWKRLKRSIGISAMHMALLPNGKVVAFDRTDFGPSNISLPAGKCRRDPLDQALIEDCYAHSVEFDAATRSLRPLTVLTDTWCSSGALAPDGRLVQVGGFNDGDRTVRYFSPCAGCDWAELPNALAVRRWYASSQLLPDGRIIVVGGRGQFNYEFIPKSGGAAGVYPLAFLKATKEDSLLENNLYPFLHLSPDGHLFIFANDRSILFDFARHAVVKTFPAMPGGVARNYPSTGSSVLLPLVLGRAEVAAEVLVCGGAPHTANYLANAGTFLPAARTCGRLRITDSSPSWKMEEMPLERVMGDMILLPTGDVLVINGAARGTAGWGVGREPVLNPVLYRTGTTYAIQENEFRVLNPSPVPRMYHSAAILLPDGRVLVGGSNPNMRYNFSGVLFPTELSLEAFSPPYLDTEVSRPEILSPAGAGVTLSYNHSFQVEFRTRADSGGKVYLTMLAPSFTTHSLAMNQRLLVLGVTGIRPDSGKYIVDAVAPATAALAPPGYYLLHVVVHGGIPSRGVWVRVK